jgi:hypothetical protein
MNHAAGRVPNPGVVGPYFIVPPCRAGVEDENLNAYPHGFELPPNDRLPANIDGRVGSASRLEDGSKTKAKWLFRRDLRYSGVEQARCSPPRRSRLLAAR